MEEVFMGTQIWSPTGKRNESVKTIGFLIMLPSSSFRGSTPSRGSSPEPPIDPAGPVDPS